jgi:hypothetical protein
MVYVHSETCPLSSVERLIFFSLVIIFMAFLCKQPCVLARVLNASDCPPDNVLHEIPDYPLYYDALYFPQDHPLLFQTEESVCRWLLTELQQHCVICPSCVRLQIASSSIKNHVQYNEGFFNIIFSGLQNVIPICDVESSCFSFCRLCRQFLMGTSKIQSLTTHLSSTAHDLCFIDAERVLHETPSWLVRDDAVFSTCLFRLSVSKLGDVARSLPHGHCRSKQELIQTIMTDICYQRQQLLPSQTTPNSLVVVARSFQTCYRNDVTNALRDLRLLHHFQKDVFGPERLNVYGHASTTWLVRPYTDMLSKLMHISKSHIFQSLRQLPFHIRPSYDFRQVQLCRQTLVSHVRSRILYLVSLSSYQFFQVYFLVLPFDCDYRCARRLLTE